MINRANWQDGLTNSKKSPTREFGGRRLAEELQQGDARKVAVALMGEGKLGNHVMRVNACSSSEVLAADRTSGAESSFPKSPLSLSQSWDERNFVDNQ